MEYSSTTQCGLELGIPVALLDDTREQCNAPAFELRSRLSFTTSECAGLLHPSARDGPPEASLRREGLVTHLHSNLKLTVCTLVPCFLGMVSNFP